MAYRIVRRGISIYLDWKSTRTIEIKIFDYIDLITLLMTLTYIVFWFKYHAAQELPKFPIENEKSFADFAEMISQDFTIGNTLAAFLLIFYCLGNLRLLTTQFPSFGALFETIKIAKVDLIKIFWCMLVISLGFVITVYVLLGPYLNDSDRFYLSCFKVFRTLFGDERQSDFTDDLFSPYESNFSFVLSISDYIFISLMVIMNFILLKYTVTIVIIRYKYLREKIQLENEVRGKIVQKNARVKVFMCNYTLDY